MGVLWSRHLKRGFNLSKSGSDRFSPELYLERDAKGRFRPLGGGPNRAELAIVRAAKAEKRKKAAEENRARLLNAQISALLATLKAPPSENWDVI